MIAVYRSAKHVDYRSLTGTRAGRISQALEKYHARRRSFVRRLRQHDIHRCDNQAALLAPLSCDALRTGVDLRAGVGRDVPASLAQVCGVRIRPGLCQFRTPSLYPDVDQPRRRAGPGAPAGKGPLPRTCTHTDLFNFRSQPALTTSPARPVGSKPWYSTSTFSNDSSISSTGPCPACSPWIW